MSVGAGFSSVESVVGFVEVTQGNFDIGRWPYFTGGGQKFRLREKGVANSRSGTRGDQIVEIAIQAPDPRDERTRELLREYAELHPEDPRTEMWSKV